MKSRLFLGWIAGIALWMLQIPAFGQSGSVSSVSLQGQNKGDTIDWSGGNLQNWQELDFIPCRVLVNGAANNQTITINFPHLSGTTPGFENLYDFTAAGGVSFASAPVLATPAGGTWSYTFTINATSAGGSVNFFARLAAGAHVNTGSSLKLGGSPSSMGELQIHKPQVGPGAPNLAIVKTGPATIPQGGTITYTLSYTNKATGTNTGVGVQISDFLPPNVVVDPSTLPTNADLVGSTLFFDLPNLPPGASGQVTFLAAVPFSTPAGTVISNLVQILSSQDDADNSDNMSAWLTTVTTGCTGATVTTPPGDQAVCPGGTASFTVAASGTSLTYQWYKGSGSLSGKTNNTLTLTNVGSGDAATYSVVVTALCGTPVTNSATLTVNSNVIISTSPVSVTTCPGTTANFSVNATGTGLTYQWYQGTSALSGQTNSTLTLANVNAGEQGAYSVVVSGVCGTPVTNSATLTVNSNVIISTAPVSVTTCPGTTANFSVNASGTGLSYQWYQGASALGGQTNSTLTLANVNAGEQGAYSVVVSGACGTPVTNSATLTVNSNVIISTAPVSVTTCPGTTANFSVNATGTGLTYQWYQGTSALSGQTNSTLTLANVNAGEQGAYSVVVSGTCGTPVTNSATLTVNSNVIISTSPVSVTTCPGTTANFSVNATGTGLTYQWYQGTSALNGQTNSTLMLANVNAGEQGTYSVVVTGVCGTPVTNSATLTVNSNVVISTAPANVTTCPGTTANFSVNASGTDLSYQWYQGTSALGGQTNSTLMLTNVNAGEQGIYSVVVTSVCGTPVTNSATLTVNSSLIISTPPVSVTTCPGTTANFSVNASGTDLSYQWYQGTSALNGQTNSTLTLANVNAGEQGAYSVVVTSICGTPVTNSATLTVNSNVIISTSPVSVATCPGTTANFSVNATGTDLAYQWYQGTSALNGQTNSTLTLTNVNAAQQGIYSVVVTGVCGTPVTNSATLTVNSNVIISTAPASVTTCPGTTANFAVNATGTGLTYQWYQGTNALGGQTNSTLTLTDVGPSQQGIYRVVVSDICGGSVTNSAVLVVNQNVSVAPLASVTNSIGGSVTFTAVASGTGPFTYQWFKGASALSGQTNSTLTLNHLQPSDSGAYSVSVTGACGGAASTGAELTVNLPPVVTITHPTNGTVFVAPATFQVIADASDPDGTVTNVAFFVSTNGVDFVFAGETNATPYQIIESNLPVGQYTFVAQATDNFGATGNSAPVTVTVVPPQPPTVTVVGHLTLNLQDGFQWLTNVVCNPEEAQAKVMVVSIHNLTNSSIHVVNATGTNNGVPFVASAGAILPGTCWTNIIKFYDPLQVAFFPTLTVDAVDSVGAGPQVPSGTPQPIFSGKFLRDGSFLVEFATVNGSTYYVQYSSDMLNWNTVFPPYAGTGQHFQFIDSGPPQTQSFPSTSTTRFYRVLKVQ